MTTTYLDRDAYIQRLRGEKFTLSEVCEVEKFLDENFPTPVFGSTLKWRNAKTKKPVVIGYIR